MNRPGPSWSRREVLRIAAATLTVGAAAIHFAVIPEHLEEALAVGLFFAASAWAQVVWSMLALRAGPTPLLVAGMLGNLAIASVWAASRTIGLPVGPNPWAPEAVGFIDLLATILEIAAATVTIAALRASDRQADVRRARFALAALAIVIVPITTVAIATDAHHEETVQETRSTDEH